MDPGVLFRDTSYESSDGSFPSEHEVRKREAKHAEVSLNSVTGARRMSSEGELTSTKRGIARPATSRKAR